MDDRSDIPHGLIQCRHCGAVLDGRRLNGLCPACTWRALADAEEDDPEPAARSAGPNSLLRIPGYIVLEEIARGGMGIVYRARQLEPDRLVALKMLLPHQLSSAGMRERFRLEIRAIASLEHPAILPIYQVGEQEEFPFFTMKFAAGGTLASRVLKYRGQFRPIAELMATLAEAVHFAHTRGVLHRDLKPGNILFDDLGRPYVSDFGLAKFTQFSGDTPTLTKSFHLVGTPQFLPPEVAAGTGQNASIAGDIYGLGGILYELLAGEPPFVAENLTSLLRMILEREPVWPSKRQPGIPRDLEVICLRCLAKEPARRYDSARELAEDLRLWLAGRAIHARPASRAERIWKWAKRNPLTAMLALALVVAGASGGFALHQSHGNVQRALADARRALGESLLSQARFQRATGRVGQRFETLDLLKRAVSPEAPSPSVSSLVELRTEAAGALALPDLRIVARWPVFVDHYETGLDFTRNLDRYVTAVAEGGFTIFSTKDRSVWRHCTGATNNPALQFRFSQDSRWLAAAFQDGHAEIHDLVAATPPRSWPGKVTARTFVEFSPQGEAALISIHGRGAVWHDLTTGTEREILSEVERPEVLRFDPSGRLLAFAIGPRCAVWRLTHQTTVWSQTLNHRVRALAWSPDGSQLAAACDGRHDTQPGKPEPGMWLLDAGTGAVRAQFNFHEAAIEQVAFHPAEGSLMSLGWDGRLVWHSLQGEPSRLVGDGAALVLRFAPDGSRIGFSPSREELALADVAWPEVLREWPAISPPDQEVYGMRLSPDGTLLATATQSGIHLWDALSGSEQAAQPLPAQGFWTTLFFHPDGRSLIYSAANFGVMRTEIRRRSTGEGRPRFELGQPQRISPRDGFVVQEFAPDGRSLVVGEIQQQTRNDRVAPTFWLWQDGDPAQARKLAEKFPMTGYRLVAGGRWGITTDNLLPDLWVWNPATGERVRSLGIPLGVMSQVSPDRNWIVTSSRAEFVLWDANSWQTEARWPARPNQRTGSEGAFADDGRTFAAFDANGRIDLFALPEGRQLLALPPPQPMRFQSLIFGVGGTRLYLLRGNGRVYEWNLAVLHKELAQLGLDWGELKPKR